MRRNPSWVDAMLNVPDGLQVHDRAAASSERREVQKFGHHVRVHLVRANQLQRNHLLRHQLAHLEYSALHVSGAGAGTTPMAQIVRRLAVGFCLRLPGDHARDAIDERMSLGITDGRFCHAIEFDAQMREEPDQVYHVDGQCRQRQSAQPRT